MIEVKQAIRTARDYFVDAYNSAEIPLQRLLLEGVEKTEDDQYWLVTFGFDIERPLEAVTLPAPEWGALGWEAEGPSKYQRSYHTVWVRSDDGTPEKLTPG